jgi:hypothetical protein
MNRQSGPETPYPQAASLPAAAGGPSIWPFPPLIPNSSISGPPPGYSESYGRAEYRAFRLGRALLIQAWGTLSSVSQIPDIRQSPLKIYPPQFDFWVYTPQFALPALKPFKLSEIFGFPAGAPVVVIHDADGHHTVEIEDLAFDERPAVALQGGTPPPEEIGYGKSFEAAFAAAVAALPRTAPGSADGLATYRLIESGLRRGGFPGIDLHYARVDVTFS